MNSLQDRFQDLEVLQPPARVPPSRGEHPDLRLDPSPRSRLAAVVVALILSAAAIGLAARMLIPEQGAPSTNEDQVLTGRQLAAVLGLDLVPKFPEGCQSYVEIRADESGYCIDTWSLRARQAADSWACFSKVKFHLILNPSTSGPSWGSTIDEPS